MQESKVRKPGARASKSGCPPKPNDVEKGVAIVRTGHPGHIARRHDNPRVRHQAGAGRVDARSTRKKAGARLPTGASGIEDDGSVQGLEFKGTIASQAETLHKKELRLACSERVNGWT